MIGRWGIRARVTFVAFVPMLVLATLMAGGILLLAGWLRAGNLITYVPELVLWLPRQMGYQG